jgi:hypothetical protein
MHPSQEDRTSSSSLVNGAGIPARRSRQRGVGARLACGDEACAILCVPREVETASLDLLQMIPRAGHAPTLPKATCGL